MKSLRIQLLTPALLALLAITQMTAATTARAQDKTEAGWLFEFGMGSARDRNEVAPGIGVGETNYVKRAYLGYRIWKYFGIQAGYVDFATIEYSNAAAGTTDKFDFDGYHAKVFLNVPFRWDNDGFYALYLSGGGWRWDSAIKSTNPTRNLHTHGVGPSGSAGLLFSGRSSALKLEYERFWTKPTVPAGNFLGNENKLKYDVISFNFLFYL